MKAVAVILMFAVVFAGCTDTTSGDGSLDLEGEEGRSLAPFEFSVAPPTGPVQGAVANFTVTVNREAMVAVEPVPRIDFVSDHERVNGTRVFEVLLEPGLQRVGVDINTLDAEGGSLHEYAEYEVNVLASATVSIDYGSASDNAPVSGDTVWVNMVDYDAQGHYDDEGVQHPGYTNIHDVMAAWEAQADHVIDYSYNSGFGGFSIDRIDGDGNSLDQGEPPWWCYAVNGEGADQGISIMRFTPGDEVYWELGDCALAGLEP